MQENEILIYSKRICPYCVKAKALFHKKGKTFTEIMVDENEDALGEMIHLSGRRSVPQIFIGEQHIGGCDDLYALDAKGGLDPLLKGEKD